MEERPQRHPDKDSVAILGNNRCKSLDKKFRFRFKLDCCQDSILCTSGYMEILGICTDGYVRPYDQKKCGDNRFGFFKYGISERAYSMRR